MGTTKVLVVANAPGVLQRVEQTLAGLEVHVAIRLRDVGAAVRQGHFNLVVVYLGFDEQSTVELVATLAGEPKAPPPAIVCLAPLDPKASLAELEGQLRAAGAVEFIRLADYPHTTQGGDVLRKRLLSAIAVSLRATPVVRVLRRAVAIAGGAAQLAAYLEVREAELLRWIQGEEAAPEPVFLAAFDLVLTDLERGKRRPS